LNFFFSGRSTAFNVWISGLRWAGPSYCRPHTILLLPLLSLLYSPSTPRRDPGTNSGGLVPLAQLHWAIYGPEAGPSGQSAASTAGPTADLAVIRRLLLHQGRSPDGRATPSSSAAVGGAEAAAQGRSSSAFSLTSQIRSTARTPLTITSQLKEREGQWQHCIDLMRQQQPQQKEAVDHFSPVGNTPVPARSRAVA
jgi:hypothetical protein